MIAVTGYIPLELEERGRNSSYEDQIHYQLDSFSRHDNTHMRHLSHLSQPIMDQLDLHLSTCSSTMLEYPLPVKMISP